VPLLDVSSLPITTEAPVRPLGNQRYIGDKGLLEQIFQFAQSCIARLHAHNYSSLVTDDQQATTRHHHHVHECLGVLPVP